MEIEMDKCFEDKTAKDLEISIEDFGALFVDGNTDILKTQD